MDYKNWKHNYSEISADVESVDYIMQNNEYEAKAPSVSDLGTAQEWLALYCTGEQDELFQSLVNVIAFLDMTAKAKQHKINLTEAKRAYAKQHGIKVSQVKVKKEAK